MKKILLILITIIFITGCEEKEIEVKNPDGDSKIYQYLKDKNYNPNQYTLKLENGNQKITIITLDDQTYYEVESPNETLITIEKNNQKYTLNKENKTYTKEYISLNDNFVKGYLPENLDTIKNQNYIKGSQREGLTKYKYEKYTYSEGTTIYYFKNNKLKKIKNQTPLNQTEVTFKSLSSKVDKTKFNIPKNYEEISY